MGDDRRQLQNGRFYMIYDIDVTGNSLPRMLCDYLAANLCRFLPAFSNFRGVLGVVYDAMFLTSLKLFRGRDASGSHLKDVFITTFKFLLSAPTLCVSSSV